MKTQQMGKRKIKREKKRNLEDKPLRHKMKNEKEKSINIQIEYKRALKKFISFWSNQNFCI